MAPTEEPARVKAAYEAAQGRLERPGRCGPIPAGLSAMIVLCATN
jgi:hypothetical protein